jgi:hypothetical protein
MNPCARGVPLGRRSPHKQGPYSTPIKNEDAYSPVHDALRDVAEWHIARYSTRLDWIHLTVEGYYSSTAHWGIIPNVGRGTAPDGSPETSETLPTHDRRRPVSTTSSRDTDLTLWLSISSACSGTITSGRRPLAEAYLRKAHLRRQAAGRRSA